MPKITKPKSLHVIRRAFSVSSSILSKKGPDTKEFTNEVTTVTLLYDSVLSEVIAVDSRGFEVALTMQSLVLSGAAVGESYQAVWLSRGVTKIPAKLDVADMLLRSIDLDFTSPEGDYQIAMRGSKYTTVSVLPKDRVWHHVVAKNTTRILLRKAIHSKLQAFTDIHGNVSLPKYVNTLPVIPLGTSSAISDDFSYFDQNGTVIAPLGTKQVEFVLKSLVASHQEVMEGMKHGKIYVEKTSHASYMVLNQSYIGDSNRAVPVGTEFYEAEIVFS